VEVCFEPREAWVGVYWQVEHDDTAVRDSSGTRALHATTLYVAVCLLPFLPLCITVARFWREVLPEYRGGRRRVETLR
jgi:hypothetical protein